MFRKTLIVAVFTMITSSTFAEDLMLAPCINGEVSRSGTFPSQEMEDQMNAYLEWKTEEPFYLFRVGSHKLLTAYSEE